ncbi:MAG: hypothetical protein ACE5KV_01065 [Thermoplasmata archaeon]
MIGRMLVDLFSALGTVGGLIAIFFIFYFDAMIVPLIPELFSVLIFQTSPTLEWGLLVLLFAVTGEVLGNSTLYVIVKRVGAPRFLKGAMSKYINFLILKDERLILSNRVAPAVPFVGAFMAVCNWDYKKSVAYIVIGGLLKYSILLSVVGIFNVAYPRELAQNITLVLVIVVIALSAILGYLKSRKERLRRVDMARSEAETQEG